MAAKKSDIVRRSLFGVGPACPWASRPTLPMNPESSEGRSANSRPGTGFAAAVEPAAEVALAAAGRAAVPVERTAVTVPTELLMQVKDAVAVLNGWPQQYTMARFVEEAFAAQLERTQGRTQRWARVPRHEQEDSYGPPRRKVTRRAPISIMSARACIVGSTSLHAAHSAWRAVPELCWMARRHVDVGRSTHRSLTAHTLHDSLDHADDHASSWFAIHG